MSIEKRLYQRSEKPSDFPSLLSPCHNVQRVSAPVLLLGHNGMADQIGFIKYCYFDGWDESRKRIECRKPLSVIQFRSWPESLTGTEAMRICDHHGPEYWWESGFHVFQWADKWTTLRAHDCMPPWARRDFDKLDKRAQKLVRGLSRAKASGKFSSVFDPEVPLAPNKPMPPRVYSNAGSAKLNAAKGIAEQMRIQNTLDRQQLAAGEGAYEPGLEPGQYTAEFIDSKGQYHPAKPVEPVSPPVQPPTRIPPKAEPTPDLTEFFDAD